MVIFRLLAAAALAAPRGAASALPSIQPRAVQGRIGNEPALLYRANYDRARAELELSFGKETLRIRLAPSIRAGQIPEMWRYTVPIDAFVPTARLGDQRLFSYKMLLVFGWSKSGRLPGALSFESAELSLNGHFEAAIDGAPPRVDLTPEMREAGLRHLARKHRGRTVTVFGPSEIFLDGDQIKAALDFRVDDGKPQAAILTFQLGEHGWRVEPSGELAAPPPAPAPAPEPAPVPEPRLEEFANACRNELSLLCPSQDPAAALSCLKENARALSSDCGAKLPP